MRNDPAIIIKAPERQAWESAVSLGLELREVKDNSQWKLGGLAEDVCNDFGGRSLKQFSLDISIPYNSLREYRRVYNVIPKEDRLPHLSYRHHQLAANTEEPRAWLEKASDNQWSSELLALEINKSKGKEIKDRPTLVRCEDCNNWTIEGTDDICQCNITPYKLKLPIDRTVS